MFVLTLKLMLCLQTCPMTSQLLPAHDPMPQTVAAGEMTPAAFFELERSVEMPNRAKNTKNLEPTLANDLTFIRRIYLDLTGKIPGSEQVQQFINNPDSAKRAKVIDELLASEAFTDRWTVFYEDLFRNRMVFETPGYRNNFQSQIRNMVDFGTPLDAMARKILSDNGEGDGNAMFFWTHIQLETDYRLDQLDDQVGYITETMLGVTSTCISCHDGAYHLEDVNVSLAAKKRSDFWAMAAFLSKSFVRAPIDDEDFKDDNEFLASLRYIDVDQSGFDMDNLDGYYLYAEYEDWDGEYRAQSKAGDGMRPPRSGGLVQPAYLFGGQTPRKGESRRDALARIITEDRQFARNQVNRIWAHLFGEGFVEPMIGWDPARVDAATALLNNTTVQPRTPDLLEFLTDYLIQNNYNLRSLLRLIVNSNAYQWDYAYTENDGNDRFSYWRTSKRVRRLDAESIVDGVFETLGVPRQYVVAGRPYELVHSTWKLPGTESPSPAALLIFSEDGDDQFIIPPEQLGYESEDDYFYFQYSTMEMLQQLGRGDWVNAIPRNNDGGSDQTLLLMNDWGINYYLEFAHYIPLIRVAAEELERSSNNREPVINALFQRILFRTPTSSEMALFRQHMSQNQPYEAVTDIIWALLNHPDFLYNR